MLPNSNYINLSLVLGLVPAKPHDNSRERPHRIGVPRLGVPEEAREIEAEGNVSALDLLSAKDV
jgi:hypothetical protein